jgi:hypothetical protein
MKILLALAIILSLLVFANCSEDELSKPSKPELISPGNSAKDMDLGITFKWNPVSNAEAYSFQLSLTSEFTNTVNNSSGIEGVSITIDNLMPMTKYYWRVNAKNSAGISDWSEVWELTTEAVQIPSPIAPENNSILSLNQTTLEWTPISYVDSYTLQVSLNEDFSSLIVNQENLNETNYSISDLEWFTSYHWRIRSSLNSCVSDWSEVWSFSSEIPIPINGLIAYYPFNGNANDESENSLNGTVHGATLASDRNGSPNKAYLFDGDDDYISVPHSNSLNLIGDFTISVWYKSDGCESPCDPPAYHTLIMKRDVSVGPNDNWPWGVSISYISGGTGAEFKKLYSTRRTNSEADYKWSNNFIETNVWQHAVIVVEDNIQTIYINNVFDSTTGFTLPQQENTKNLNIGWSLRPSLEQFKGKIDDIRLYNRALTTLEISSLFHE